MPELRQGRQAAAYICIAPAMIPLIYGAGTLATIGHDEGTANAIEAMGAATSTARSMSSWWIRSAR